MTTISNTTSFTRKHREQAWLVNTRTRFRDVLLTYLLLESWIFAICKAFLFISTMAAAGQETVPVTVPPKKDGRVSSATTEKIQALDEYIERHYNPFDTEKIEALSKEFFDQDEFIIVRNFFPKEMVQEFFVPEVKKVEPLINRSYVPLQKKGGSISSYIIAQKAPALHRLYHSKPFIQYLQGITKEEKFFECPPRDPHAVALYYYTEAGDHISWHYDSSFYAGDESMNLSNPLGKRFTVLVGMVDDHDRESCKLLCHLYTRKPEKEVEVKEITLEPGDLVMFNGDKLWHSVSPMTADPPNQRRTV
jgi:alkylated DNA repair dioxygenase AlkB